MLEKLALRASPQNPPSPGLPRELGPHDVCGDQLRAPHPDGSMDGSLQSLCSGKRSPAAGSRPGKAPCPLPAELWSMG